MACSIASSLPSPDNWRAAESCRRWLWLTPARARTGPAAATGFTIDGYDGYAATYSHEMNTLGSDSLQDSGCILEV